jgi:hypothetical protein
MPRVKIKVERGNGLQQVVTVDTEATKGATIGKNVYNPDGTLYVPGSGGASASIRNGYGILISGTNPKTINVNRSANFDWQGQHNWEKPLWAPDGTAAAPAYTFGSDPNTGLYRVGADNLGISTGGALRWDINSTRSLQHDVPGVIQRNIGDTAMTRVGFQSTSFHPTSGNHAGAEVKLGTGNQPAAGDLTVQWGLWETAPATDGVLSTPPAVAGYGFRWLMDAQLAAAGDLIFYTHDNSAAGTEVYRHRRDRAQMFFASGSASRPTISWVANQSTGFRYDASAATVAVVGGVDILGISGNFVQATRCLYSNQALRALGTAVAPASGVGTEIGWDSAGTTGYVQAYNRTAATFQPVALIGSTVALRTGATTRFLVGAAGQLGIGGANYGTANTQAIVSGGASAAPSWRTVVVDGQTQTISGDKTWSGLQTLNPNGVSPPAGSVNADAALLLAKDAPISIQQLAIGSSLSLGYRFVSAGGSFGAPTAVSTADVNYMAFIGAGGYDGTNWQTGAAGLWGIRPAGTWSGTSRPTRLVAESTAIGSTARRVLLALDNALMAYGNSTDNPTHTFYGSVIFATGLQNFANDAAAAAGGIAINQLYRNGSIVQIRVT